MQIKNKTFDFDLSFDSEFAHEKFIQALQKTKINLDQIIRVVFSGECGSVKANIAYIDERLDFMGPGMFKFRKRKYELTGQFNVALMVPTGIGASIGGHAGDAGPVAKLIAQFCDQLVTHPNVVNASDINEMSENTLYVEGSSLTRLLNGSIGLQKVRSNRVLVLSGKQSSDRLSRITVNAVDAARATYGLNCPGLHILQKDLVMKAGYDLSGIATGEVSGVEHLMSELIGLRHKYDAVAVTSFIDVPMELHNKYFTSHGEVVNPWGGAEAVLTHGLSLMLGLPTAHSPMAREFSDFGGEGFGYVDPRMSAEAISLTFFQCTLKGLMKSPKILEVTEDLYSSSEILTVENVSALVTPDHCVGQPILAALEQGIPVIAVRGNKSIMKHDLSALPFKEGQLIFVENYLEACGVLGAMKSGVSIESLQRPIKNVKRTPLLGGEGNDK